MKWGKSGARLLQPTESELLHRKQSIDEGLKTYIAKSIWTCMGWLCQVGAR